MFVSLPTTQQERQREEAGAQHHMHSNSWSRRTTLYLRTPTAHHELSTNALMAGADERQAGLLYFVPAHRVQVANNTEAVGLHNGGMSQKAPSGYTE